jgi:hypothetical protein
MPNPWDRTASGETLAWQPFLSGLKISGLSREIAEMEVLVNLAVRRLVEGHHTAATFVVPELVTAAAGMKSGQVKAGLRRALEVLSEQVESVSGSALTDAELENMIGEFGTPLLKLREKVLNSQRVNSYRASRRDCPTGASAESAVRSQSSAPVLQAADSAPAACPVQASESAGPAMQAADSSPAACPVQAKSAVPATLSKEQATEESVFVSDIIGRHNELSK